MGQVEVKGFVSQIQEFSVHDGDGIRTTIFLNGCPLRCQWCANPETWSSQGTAMSVTEVVSKVMGHGIFFRASGGGVTFSGGEAACQPEFLKALIEAFDDLGVDMALETACSFRWETLAHHLGRLSLIFADIKHMDDSIHRSLTGQGNAEILENIGHLGQLGIRMVIRIPLIPGVNDDEINLIETARFVRTVLPGTPIEILPYHNFGMSKYQALGLTAPVFEVPDRDDVARARTWIEREGVATTDFV